MMTGDSCNVCLGMTKSAEEKASRATMFKDPGTKTAKMANQPPKVPTQTAVVHGLQSTPTTPLTDTHYCLG